MTLTITLPVLILLGISLALFIGTTYLCHCQGMFDGGGGYGGHNGDGAGSNVVVGDSSGAGWNNGAGVGYLC